MGRLERSHLNDELPSLRGGQDMDIVARSTGEMTYMSLYSSPKASELAIS